MDDENFFLDTKVKIEVVAGYAQRTFRELQNLTCEDIIYLDKYAGELHEIFVNKQLVGHGFAVDVYDYDSTGIYFEDIIDLQNKEKQDIQLLVPEENSSDIISNSKNSYDLEIEKILKRIAQKNKETKSEVINSNEENIIIPTQNEIDEVLNRISKKIGEKTTKIIVHDFRLELLFTKQKLEQLKMKFVFFIPKISKLYENTFFSLFSIKEADYSLFDNYDYMQLFDNYKIFDQRNCEDDYITLCVTQSLLDLFGINNNDITEFQNIISNPILLEIEKYLKEVTNNKNISISPLYVTNDYHNLQKDIYTKIELIIKVKGEKDNSREGYIKVLLPSKILYNRFTKKGKKIKTFQSIYNIPINLYARIGSAERSLRDISELGKGTICLLDKCLNETIDLIANDVIIAKGKLIVRDEYFAVKITDILYDNN